jgi:hypothetical protein
MPRRPREAINARAYQIDHVCPFALQQSSDQRTEYLHFQTRPTEILGTETGVPPGNKNLEVPEGLLSLIKFALINSRRKWL